MNTQHSRMIARFATVLAALALLAGASRADLQEETKLVASDAMPFHYFGESVSTAGDLALVGARGADSNAGAAYVYRFDGTTWLEEQRLEAIDRASGDRFGAAVSLRGDVALIGATGVNDSTGAVYVFRFDGSDWIETQKVTAGDGGSGGTFGAAIAFEGDVAVVGAVGDGEQAFIGSAYVFDFDGSAFTESQKLTASDGSAGARFGTALAVDSGRVLIGASGDRSSLGATYAFRYDGATWVEEQKLTVDDDSAFVRFGAAISMRGDLALIGAPDGEGAGESEGAAYLFDFDGSSWILRQKIAAAEGEVQADFGSSVALGEGVALVGAPSFGNSEGIVYDFREDGSLWREADRHVPSDATPFAFFGKTVAIGDDFAFVGASDGDASYRGAVYALFDMKCLHGTVDFAHGGAFGNVLYVNRSTGGFDHRVESPDGSSIAVTMLRPVAGGNGRFVLHADVGTPSRLTNRELPFALGTSCFPFLSSDGATPVLVANNLGKTNLVGASHVFGTPTADPPSATTQIDLPSLPLGTVLTFQAIVIDPASASSKGASTTNAVIVEVVP